MEAKKANIVFLLIASLVLQSSYCSTCPQISTQSRIKFHYNYQILNDLKLPNTNILLVNAVLLQNEQITSSIVYYYDISSTVDNVISIFQPDFPINQMEYIQQLNQILVQNNGSNYALAIQQQHHVFVIDVVKQKQILMLDITAYSYGTQYGVYITTAKLFSLQNGQKFIFVIYQNGPCTWSLDLEEMKYTFN
ncbi:hypothetical protein ABPG72_013197 [Tetrahymena utriculariae]